MSRANWPEPPAELKQLSGRLCALIRDLIRDRGPIPFADYMDRVLYQPGLGYYSAGLHKFGESGDFVTAPELGSLFAGCLARQIEQLARHLGTYDVLEIGAGSGQLAYDILQLIPSEHLPRRYVILDRSADLRQVQQEKLAVLPPVLRERVEWRDTPPETQWSGILLANEVLDAMAVERFEIGEQGIHQLCVESCPEGFAWARRPAPTDLAVAVEALGVDVAPGFRSEINLHTRPWLKELTSALDQGLALFIDYGYPRSEYYMPQRRDGTLMCHYRHRAHDDVFFLPGLQDLTAWVDFTALAEAAVDCDLDVEGYTNQAMFLLGCGLEEVLRDQGSDSEHDALSLNAQARQLTLPGMMGERFQVMGLGRKLDFEPVGFRLQDLSYRL